MGLVMVQIVEGLAFVAVAVVAVEAGVVGLVEY